MQSPQSSTKNQQSATGISKDPNPDADQKDDAPQTNSTLKATKNGSSKENGYRQTKLTFQQTDQGPHCNENADQKDKSDDVHRNSRNGQSELDKFYNPKRQKRQEEIDSSNVIIMNHDDGEGEKVGMDTDIVLPYTIRVESGANSKSLVKIASNQRGFNANFPMNGQNPQIENNQTKNQKLNNLLAISDLLLGNKVFPNNLAFTSELRDLEKPGLNYREPLQKFRYDNVNKDLIDAYKDRDHEMGTKERERFFCDQKLYRQRQPDGKVKILWGLHNVGHQWFLNRDDEACIDHYIESNVFESIDGMMWKLRLKPGSWDSQRTAYWSQQSSGLSRIDLYALPTPKEKAEKFMNRKVQFEYAWFDKDGQRQTCPIWKNTVDFTQQDNNLISWYSIENFAYFPCPLEMRVSSMAEELYIEFSISHLIPNPVAPKVPENTQNPQNAEDRDQEPEKELPAGVDQIDSTIQGAGNDRNQTQQKLPIQRIFRGLVNEGTTCYINSLIQTLFFIRDFRNAVYKMPSNLGIYDKQTQENIPFCLQRIFYNLQIAKQTAVRTNQMLTAFGWSNRERNQQQDVNEFNCILSDQLEKQMEGTEVQGTYKKLFEGKSENVIKCDHIDYESTKEDVFNTISLSVNGNESIEDSIRQYVAAEKLDGDNQYETETHGKQDAKKFIRFKELPPVLQISLNRYEYDPYKDMMAKNNQAFKFGDTLDLESLLSEETNHSSPSQMNRMMSQRSSNSQHEEKVVNMYHLHSILIHSGTVDCGHYFAYIRPEVSEDRWYCFNDANVYEVPKYQALLQGQGGNMSEYELVKFPPDGIPGSSSQLNIKYEQTFCNAYMLMYIRKTERAWIMDDSISINQQIPRELRAQFEYEAMFRDQIEYDQDIYNRYCEAYIQTQQTLLYNDWDGPLISQKIKDLRAQEVYRFENQMNSHKMLLVHKLTSTNEFITMLQKRFFQDVELKDIWLYKIGQNKFKASQTRDSEVHFNQTFCKFQYDLELSHDVPLFNKINTQSQRNHFNEYEWNQRWKNQPRSVYLYIMINPKCKRQQVLEKMTDEQEIQDYKDHYQQYLDFIQKTDMAPRPQLTRMYNKYLNKCNYKFGGQTKPKSMSHDEAVSYYRNDFVFDWSEALDSEQEELLKQLKEFNSKQQMDDEDAEMKPPEDKKHNKGTLLFLKYINFEGKKQTLQNKGTMYLDPNEPLDLEELINKAIPEDRRGNLENLRIYLEPTSVNKANAYNKPKDQNVPFAQFLKQERGIIKFPNPNLGWPYYFYSLDVQKVSSIPACKVFQYNGCILNIACPSPSDFEDFNEQEGEEDVTAFEEFVNKKYMRLYKHLACRTNVTLCVVSEPESVSTTRFDFKNIGTFEFNHQDTYDSITSTVAYYYNYFECNTLDGELIDESVNMDDKPKPIDPNYIQFYQFDGNVVDHSYYERVLKFVNTPLVSEMREHFNYEDVIDYLASEDLVFYFRVLPHQIKYNQIDDCCFVRFKYNNQVKSSKCIRRESLTKFTQRFFNQQFQERSKEEISLEELLPFIVDRESNIIKKTLPFGQKMDYIAGTTSSNTYIYQVPLLKIHHFTKKQYKVIKKIKQEEEQEKRGNFVVYAFVQLYDQYRNRISEQFPIPWGAKSENHNYSFLSRMIFDYLANRESQIVPAGSQITNLLNENQPIQMFHLIFKPKSNKSGSGKGQPPQPDFLNEFLGIEVSTDTMRENHIKHVYCAETQENFYQLNQSKDKFIHFAAVIDIQAVATTGGDEGKKSGNLLQAPSQHNSNMKIGGGDAASTILSNSNQGSHNKSEDKAPEENNDKGEQEQRDEHLQEQPPAKQKPTDQEEGNQQAEDQQEQKENTKV